LYLAYKQIKGFNKSTNNNTQTFQQVSLRMGLKLVLKQNLDNKWASFFNEANIPFNVLLHLMFLKAMKATSESQTLLQTPIIPWIVHMLVKMIQG